MKTRVERLMSRNDGYRTMSDYTYSRLREQILNSELAPGQRIDQDALAEELGVSRMPIRESLRRLGAEDLVIITPHRGVVVAPLSPEDLKDLYIMRDAIETTAARLGVNQLARNDLKRMYDLVPAMEEIVERNDPVAWLEVDWSFHSTLYTAAQSPRLLNQVKILREEASRYRRLSLAEQEEIRRGLEGHLEILDLCSKGDAEGVAQIIRATLAESRDRMLKLIEGQESSAEIEHVAES